MSTDSDVSYEPCIVSFIDVLGFRNLIENRSASEVHEVLRKLESFAKPPSWDRPQRAKTAGALSTPFAFTMSDAVIRVWPYTPEHHADAFFLEVLNLLHAQIGLVENGVLIRAGMTAGNAHVGTDGKGPVFGPAVVRAYEIESQEAIYPRIVVDDDALKELQAQQLLSVNCASDIEELLRTGEDGTLFIDYLRAAQEEIEHSEDYFSFIEQHRDIISSGRNNSHNRRTRRKYEWLAHYHNALIDDILEHRSGTDEERQIFYEVMGVADPTSYLNSLTVPDT